MSHAVFEQERWRLNGAGRPPHWVARLIANIGLSATLAFPAAAQQSAQGRTQQVRATHGPSMIRFEFDNDTFLGSDDAFSAGWSLQYHSGLADRWTGPLESRIGLVPGLGDDGWKPGVTPKNRREAADGWPPEPDASLF